LLPTDINLMSGFDLFEHPRIVSGKFLRVDGAKPASSIDSKPEMVMLDALARLLDGRTVAHRRQLDKGQTGQHRAERAGMTPVAAGAM
jgi:hypothetical protein